MTIKELKEELLLLGVEPEEGAKKADLEKQLEEAKNEPEEELEEPSELVGKLLGNSKITAHSKKTLNGRELNDISLANGQTMLLTDSDLENQVKE